MANDLPAQSTMSSTGERVGIVGGGILGMFLALRLRQAGVNVTILESAPSTGGLASAEVIGGYVWDRFYHVILLSDSHTRALLAELGLEGRLRWGVTRTGFFTDGRLHSLSNNLEFLLFPPLSFIDKLRLGVTIFVASKIRDGRSLERIPVERWLERWSGRRVVEKIWLPLLKSKLGDNYKVASASFIWAIIARMYAARRSGLKREMFGYVDGGYAAVLQALQAKLNELGVETRFGTRVDSVRDNGTGVTIALKDGTQLGFSKAVLTVPTDAIARICPQLDAAEKKRLSDVVYQGIVCASLLTKQPLSSFYVTNITDRWVPFTGVIEMTALVDKERFGGNSLIYLPCYLPQNDPYWQRSDAEIREEFVAALVRMYPSFKPQDVIAFNIARAKQVLAISTLGYSDDHLPQVVTSLPNVFVLNSAQIANGTLNVNETLGVVHSHFDALLKSFRGPFSGAVLAHAQG